MKRLLLAATLAALAIPSFAGSSDQWFGEGLPWYMHPCGLQAFAKYGREDTPAMRRAYDITKRDASQCERLFP